MEEIVAAYSSNPGMLRLESTALPELLAAT